MGNSGVGFYLPGDGARWTGSTGSLASFERVGLGRKAAASCMVCCEG
jgi:hypothetical protein